MMEVARIVSSEGFIAVLRAGAVLLTPTTNNLAGFPGEIGEEEISWLCTVEKNIAKRGRNIIFPLILMLYGRK